MPNCLVIEFGLPFSGLKKYKSGAGWNWKDAVVDGGIVSKSSVSLYVCCDGEGRMQEWIAFISGHIKAHTDFSAEK